MIVEYRSQQLIKCEAVGGKRQQKICELRANIYVHDDHRVIDFDLCNSTKTGGSTKK